MLDHQSIFWGVRLSKPDGDEEYKHAMTRPDPPHRVNTRPAVEAGSKQEEKLVIHETKVAGTRIEERLVHVYTATEETYAYLSAAVAEDGNLARADWRIVDAAASAAFAEQGIPHVDVPLPDEDAFLDWMAELFTEMAKQQIVDEGAPRTQEEILRRSAAMVAEWLGMAPEQAETEVDDAWLESTGPLDQLDKDDEFQLDPTVDDPMPEVEAMFPKRQGLWARVVDVFDTACIWLYVNTIGRFQ